MQDIHVLCAVAVMSCQISIVADASGLVTCTLYIVHVPYMAGTGGGYASTVTGWISADTVKFWGNLAVTTTPGS